MVPTRTTLKRTILSRSVAAIGDHLPDLASRESRFKTGCKTRCSARGEAERGRKGRRRETPRGTAASAAAILLTAALLTARPCFGAGASPSHYWLQKASAERANQIVVNTGDILWNMSDHYFHRGDYLQVIRMGHAVVKLDSQLEEVYPSVSWLEWSDGLPGAAEADLLQGVRANPADYYLYSELADCYMIWLKRPAAAIPYYLRATDYPDAPWMVYGALAHAAEKSGDYCRAAIAWRMAIIHAHGDPVKVVPSQNNLRRVLGEIARLKAGGPGTSAGASRQGASHAGASHAGTSRAGTSQHSSTAQPPASAARGAVQARLRL